MTATILILSHSSDVHAFAAAEVLRAKGAQAIVWCTSDFPTLEGESIRFTGTPSPLVRVRGRDFDLDGMKPTAVWYRRPLFVLDHAILHRADRSFAEQQCTTFRRSLFRTIFPDAFWVNPPDASFHASQKILQHRLALESGLEMPDTLYSNDPCEIRAFMAEHGGAVVYKPLAGAPWRDDETLWATYTVEMTADKLVDDDILRQTPGIFQALLPKAYELRITIMGREVFPAKILSQATTTGRLDWRKSYHELKMEAVAIPPNVADKCRSLMTRLGIVFGCFDFVVTPQGDHLFLEVNEGGQFMFIEHYVRMPIMDVFCDFLIQADSAFASSRRQSRLSYDDIKDKAEAAMRNVALKHPEPPVISYYEGGEES